MNQDYESFFRSTRLIRLEPGELKSLRKNLQISVRKEGGVRLQEHMVEQNFLHNAKKISLSNDEKARIRSTITEIINDTEPLYMPFFNVFKIFTGAMVAIIIFTTASVGVSFAAQDSLPGDTLYTVKVNLTEPLLMRFQRSKESKVRLQAMLASKRLEEAEQLAEKSKFNSEKAAIVQKRLEMQVIALERDLKELWAQDQKASGSIAIDTATAMEAHWNIISRMGDQKKTTEVAMLLSEIGRARTLAENVSAASEFSHRVEITSEKVRNEIQRVKENTSWQQRAKNDDDFALAVQSADQDMTIADSAETSESIKIEKLNSALKKAKEANFMLLFPHREKSKIRSVQEESSSSHTSSPSRESTESSVTFEDSPSVGKVINSSSSLSLASSVTSFLESSSVPPVSSSLSVPEALPSSKETPKHSVSDILKHADDDILKKKHHSSES